jgi:hypothetical protein
MAETHSHDSGAEHEHAGDAPGHTHGMVAEETSAGGVAGRIGLTALGAVGLIVGAFLDWLGGGPSKGIDVEVPVFWTTDIAGEAGFVTSAGFAVIILGLLALLGLAFRSGWLTRLAGALGLVAFVLFTITTYRAEGSIGDLGIGMWVILASSLLILVAGFLGTRRMVS